MHRLCVYSFVVYRSAVVDGFYGNDQEAPVSPVIPEELHVVGAADERCPPGIKLRLSVVYLPDGDVLLSDDPFEFGDVSCLHTFKLLHVDQQPGG